MSFRMIFFPVEFFIYRDAREKKTVKIYLDITQTIYFLIREDTKTLSADIAATHLCGLGASKIKQRRVQLWEFIIIANVWKSSLYFKNIKETKRKFENTKKIRNIYKGFPLTYVENFFTRASPSAREVFVNPNVNKSMSLQWYNQATLLVGLILFPLFDNFLNYDFFHWKREEICLSTATIKDCFQLTSLSF